MLVAVALFIFAILVAAWYVRRQRRKARRAAWRDDNQREAARLVESGQMTAADAQWRIRQGLPMPSCQPSGGTSVPAPSHDPEGSVVESTGPTALDLLYAQMAEQEEGYRRRERERDRDLGY